MASPNRLLNKDFLLLWQGQFVSQVGSQAFAVAMMFWLKHETGSATLMGTLMMAASIPSVLLGPVAGTFADQHSRKRIIVWCDILNGLAALTLAGLLFFAPDKTDIAIVWLFAVSVFMSTVGAFFRPAISASIPDLVPADRVAGANSMNQFSMQISGLFGQGLGGVAFRLLGAPMLFLIDGLSYLFSAASEAFITIPQVIPERTKGLRAAFERFKQQTVEGFHYVWRNAGLKALFIVAAVLNFLLVPIMVLMPFFVEDFLNATPDWFGFLMAAIGVGAIIGYIGAGAIKISGKIRALAVIGGLILMAGLLMLLGWVTGVWSALILFAALGIANGFVNINIATIIQITTPSEIRGRVLGLLGTLASGLTPIAMGLSGIAADLLDQNVPLLIKICGGAATVVAVAVMFNRNLREFLAYEPPAPPSPPPATDVAPDLQETR